MANINTDANLTIENNVLANNTVEITSNNNVTIKTDKDGSAKTTTIDTSGNLTVGGTKLIFSNGTELWIV